MLKRGARFFSASVILAAFLATPIFATTSISQGFTADESIAIGSIVSLADMSTDHVVLASISNSDSLIGVAINGDSSIIQVSNGENGEIQVATSGTVPVLVSDINGGIKKGDQVTASPLKGIGMKTTSNSKVVGIAQGEPAYDYSQKQSYTDSSGNKQEVNLGEVNVLVNVTYYYKTPEKTLIPQAIQNLANAIAGKHVSSLPIIISAGIFIITIIIVVSIVYSMIKNSIISIGRNPMSQSAVNRSVIQLSALVFGILAVAVISIYVILTRL